MRHILLFFILIVVSPLLGQQSINGIVKDALTHEPIAGASVTCGDLGTLTDLDGKFTLNVEDNCTLSISYLGYEVQTMKASDAISSLSIDLIESSELLETTTITANKYEQRLSESTVSVDVIKPSLIKSSNTIKSDEVLNKLPGVQVINGQANIRGGSGFSYGAGSRVMLLLDDMPALQADAGVANWGDLPIEAVGQVEVVKGASSSLYGSSALNGIVHFRRVKPSIKPETNAFTSYTKFLDPENEKYIWWQDSTKPYRFTIGASHAQKIKKLDLLLHGLYTKLESFNANTYEDGWRGGTSLKYKINERLSIGFNVLYNTRKSGDFFIWKNGTRGIYQPFTGTLTFGTRTRMALDPYVHFFQRNGNSHKLLTRYFYTNNENNSNQSNASKTYYSEYQFNRVIEKHQLVLVAGAVQSTTDADAALFGGKTFLYQNIASYIQADKKIKKLTLSAGVRYEYNLQESPDTIPGYKIPNGLVKDDQIIARVGANYSFSPYQSLRASLGQGYRYPTVTERFISTTFGGFTIFPNPLLSPEYGWSSEIGIKQGVKIESFKGFIDVSAFVSEYEDMIEFTFITGKFGFQPINVGNTRITGGEASLTGQFAIGPVTINTITGYTYINPIYKNFENRPEIKTNLSTNQNVLKYRSKHASKLDAEAVYRFLSLGVAVQKYSHMVNIDKPFEEPVGGIDLFEIKAFRQINDKGFTLLDVRFGLEWKGIKLSLLMNNVLNQAYTVRPGLLEAPRNVTLRVGMSM